MRTREKKYTVSRMARNRYNTTKGIEGLF